MSRATELQAELDEKIAEYRAAKSGPNYSVGGRTFDHTGYRRALMEEIKELRELIILEQGAVCVSTHLLG